MNGINRKILSLVISFIFFLSSLNTWSMSVSSSTSYTGDYTLYLDVAVGCAVSYYGGFCNVLDEKVGSGSWQTVLSESEPNVFIYTVPYSNKAVGTYQYRVRTLGNGSQAGVKDGPITVQVKKPTAPSGPTGPATDNNGAYTISWGVSTGATSYRLAQRRYVNGSWGSWTVYNTGSSRSKSFSGKGDGVWQYKARGCNSRWCGSYSGTINVKVANTPGVPGSLSVDPVISTTGSHVVTRGSSSGNVSYYELQRGGNTIETNLAASWSYSSLYNGNYNYRVRACNTVSNYTSCSGWRNASAATVQDPPSFSIDDVAVTEGGNLTFTVTKNGAASTSYSVNYTTGTGGTATPGEDYAVASGTLTFTDTQTSRQVTVSTVNDTVFEGSETVYVNLSNPTGGTTVSDNQGVGTINPDGDVPPSFSIDNPQVAESGNLVFTVTKTGQSDYTHTVDYVSTDGTAGSSVDPDSLDHDYSAVSGTLSFAPGESQKTITVSTFDESGPNVPGVFESNETLTVSLSNPTNSATIGSALGTGTIIDNDDRPHFTVNDASLAEDNGTMLVYVQGKSQVGMTIDYETMIDVGDTATPSPDANYDFLSQSGTLSFDPDVTQGTAVQTIAIPIVSDDIYEDDETFTVRIFNAAYGAPIDDDKATGTILDAADVPDFTVTDEQVDEGNNLVFTVTRNGASVFTHNVDYATADDSATVADGDYTANSGTLSFAASTNATETLTFSVSTGSDNTVEPDETITVALSNASNGANLFDPDGIGTLLNDDYIPETPGSLSVTPSGSYDQNHTLDWSAANSQGAPISNYELEQDIDGEGFSIIYSGLNLSDTLNGLTAGTYTYRVRACNVSGCSPWQQTSALTVIPPPTDPDASLTVGTNPTGYDPGLTAGEFSVDASGGANYRIPIGVPPGTAGMQPSLSLSYNHRSGNALLGEGWTLGGLSVVTRCPATTAQDGLIDGIDFDGNDRLCIDGERLIQIGTGTDGEGAYTEYRTEIDGFTRVRAYGTAGNGPQKFKAWTKSGQILEYAYTADSRIEAKGRSDVRLWAVNRISDTVGNYLTVSYIENGTNGEYRPDRIDYTGNTGASLSPYASVEFEYETRTDTRDLYIGGSLVRNTKRLTNIKTYVDATLVRDYQLTYDNNGAAGVSRLTQIQECAGGGACFAPTEFTWAGDGTVPDFDNQLATQSNWSNYNFITGDWNGDGRTDLFLQDRHESTSYLYTANADGTMAQQASYTGWWAGESSADTYRLLSAGDWNGDGKTDIARETITVSGSSPPYSFSHTVDFYTSTGTGFTSTGSPITVNTSGDTLRPVSVIGDWNGDGRTDFFAHSTGTSQLYTANSSGQMTAESYAPNWSSDSYKLKAGDWNGDGRTDLARVNRSTGSTNFYLSLGVTFNTAAYSPSGWQDYDLVPADFNGDGYTDLFLDNTQSTGNSYLYFSRGDGSFVDSGYASTDWNDGAQELKAYAGDWNGDGMADLVRTGGDLYLGTGSGLAPVGFSAGFGNTLVAAGDWNGDGLSDLWIKDSTYGNSATQYLTTHTGFDVIETVTDGLGNDTAITYAPLTDSSVYTKGTGASYPDVDIQSAMYVVSQVSRDDGIGGTRDTNYSYSGARINVAGRGFLGFKTRQALDQETGISSKTTYKQVFPYTGRASKTETYLNSTLIGKATTTYASITTQSGVKFPYPDTVVKEDREIDGSLVTTTTTTNVYDSYGNPDSIRVDVTDGSETYTTFTDNTYAAPNTTDWILGRLSRAEVTQYRPSNTDTKDGTCTDPTVSGTPGTCDTRVSSFQYDAGTGLLTQEVVEPDTPSLRKQTDYTHDAFGNRETVTVSGGSGATAVASRTTTMTYDTRGQFAIEVENALGHSETRTWDARFGVKLSLTGPNNLTTTWTYDDFGRKVEESRADGTHTSMTRAWCTSGTCPADGVLKVITNETGSPQSAVISDALGRKIRTATVGFDRTVIQQDTVYDGKGRVDKKSRPYFGGTASGSIQWTSLTYDDLGRVLTKTAPDGSVTSTSYNGLQVSVTNDKNQTTTRLKNARGERVKVTDAAGTETEYHYDPFGNLVETVVDAAAGGAQITTTNEFDIRGNKIGMADPDMGSWSYAYDALGQLIQQTDAKGQVTTLSYDKLGRKTQRVDDDGGANESISTWDYDTETTYSAGQNNHSIGKPVRVTGGEGDEKSMQYDAVGRPSVTNTWIDDNTDGIQDVGEVYTTSRTYDSKGRVDTITYPESAHYAFGFAVVHNYTADGYLKTVRNLDTNDLYWRAEARNAAGQLTQFELGNGVTTAKGYDAQTGRIDSIYSDSALGTVVQDYSYQFDTLGNLTRRTKNTYTGGTLDRTYIEDFQYDSLNRLIQTDYDDGVNPVETNTYAYDAIGNLKYKAGIGDYTYGSNAGPHAVTGVDVDADQVVDHSFAYDANGNQTAGYNFTKSRSRTLTWTAYNKPRTVSEAGSTLTFSYGADRARFKQVNNTSGRTTYYIGDLYEKQVEGNTTTHVHYIRAGGETVAIYKSVGDSSSDPIGTPTSEQLRYLHRDHIGSVTEITDESAQVVEELAYDAWGKRRAPEWTPSAYQITSLETLRGFTGHEMLDEVSLVHMNGRVYDPDLGRFLSADPFVQFPDNGQSFNRYTYVNNNPLSYTDPSGFGLFDFIGDIFNAVGDVFKAVFSILPREIRPFVAIAAMFIPGGQGWAAWQLAALKGATAGLIASGGDLKAGVIGAFTAGALHGIGGEAFGEAFGSFADGARVAAQGIVGGIGSELLGGDFLSGFLSAGVVGAVGASGMLKNISTSAGKMVASSVLGGVSAKLGGGKFANGAVTGAFAYAFGSIAQRQSKQDTISDIYDPYGGDVRKLMADPSNRNVVWGVYGVVEGDLVLGTGTSYSGGGYWGTNGAGKINSATNVTGAEGGLDFEGGIYWGDTPPKGNNQYEIDIDFGTTGIVFGITGDGPYIGGTIGEGTPGVVVNPGGTSVDLDP